MTPDPAVPLPFSTRKHRITYLIHSLFGFSVTTLFVVSCFSIWGYIQRTDEFTWIGYCLSGLLWGIASGLIIGIIVGFINKSEIRTIRVHYSTGILLIGSAGILIWMNVRPSEWQVSFGNLSSPNNVDPITKALFYKGWPFSPCMFCMFHGMKWHPEEDIIQVALLLDQLIALLVLFTVAYMSECCIRHWKREFRQ